MAFDETLHDAFGRLGDRLGAELRSAAEQLTCALRQEREREAAEAEAVATRTPEPSLDRRSVDERLASGVRSICAARSLGEVLDALASCAGGEAKRAAVLIVRGERFHGWRFVGFDDIADGAGPDRSRGRRRGRAGRCGADRGGRRRPGAVICGAHDRLPRPRAAGHARRQSGRGALRR